MTQATATLDARSCDPNTDEGGRRVTDKNLGEKTPSSPASVALQQSFSRAQCLLIKEEVQRAPFGRGEG